MYSRIRKHLTPSTAIAFVALVFALTGGAYAATSGGGPSHARLTASAAKAKAKTKTGPRGPAGPAGKNGAQGPAGAAGPVGLAGAKGETGAAGANGGNGGKGADGTAGTTGPTGPSVESKSFTGAKGSCGKGGTEFKVGTAAATYACNGEEGTNGTNGANGATGPTGHEGSPWTAGGTLPSGSTERGVWGYTGTGNEVGEAIVPISFTIPVAEDLAAHVVESGETTECPGGVGKPEATAGNLCIFVREAIHVNGIFPFSPETNGEEAGKTGTLVLSFDAELGKNQTITGTWAVTAK